MPVEADQCAARVSGALAYYVIHGGTATFIFFKTTAGGGGACWLLAAAAAGWEGRCAPRYSVDGRPSRIRQRHRADCRTPQTGGYFTPSSRRAEPRLRGCCWFRGRSGAPKRKKARAPLPFKDPRALSTIARARLARAPPPITNNGTRRRRCRPPAADRLANFALRSKRARISAPARVPIGGRLVTPPDKEFSLGDMGTCMTENSWGSSSR